MGKIDHVALAVADVAATAGRLRGVHGLGAVDGVSHAGRGTANWFVPFPDGTYIELVYAVDDTKTAAQFVKRAAERGDRLTSWAIESEEVSSDAAPLGIEVITGAIVAPDGTAASGWRTAGEPPPYRSRGGLPFFITYDFTSEVAREVEEHRRGRLARAHHDVDVVGISWIEVAGKASEVEHWISPHQVDVRVVPGSPRLVRVGLAVRDGTELILGPTV